MLYFAYGSNLNKAAMRRRCPKAVPVGKFELPDSRLVFRGVADCVYEPGGKCEGALWRITEDCERELDRYEGIGSGMYRKEYVPVEGGEPGETEIMVYVMNSTGIFPPSSGYLSVIAEGYQDFGLDLEYLKAAVQASFDDKAPSHKERHRYRRTGRPALGRPEHVRLPVPAPKAARPQAKDSKSARSGSVRKVKAQNEGPSPKSQLDMWLEQRGHPAYRQL